MRTTPPRTKPTPPVQPTLVPETDTPAPPTIAPELTKAYELGLAKIKTLEDRRQSVSATYLTVNGALTTAMAFIVRDGHLHGVSLKLTVGVFLVCGIFACRLWRAIIYQLSRLIGWWYGRLQELELEFPENIRMVRAEYTALYDPKNTQIKPLGLTKNEIWLTWLFTVIYGMFLLAGVYDIVSSHFAPPPAPAKTVVSAMVQPPVQKPVAPPPTHPPKP